MNDVSAKIAQAREHSTAAGLHEVEAHSAAFFGDYRQSKSEIQAAIEHHRLAMNLLVSALPDAIERDNAKPR